MAVNAWSLGAVASFWAAKALESIELQGGVVGRGARANDRALRLAVNCCMLLGSSEVELQQRLRGMQQRLGGMQQRLRGMQRVK